MCGRRPAGFTSPKSTSAMACPPSSPPHQACSMAGMCSLSHGTVSGPALICTTTVRGFAAKTALTSSSWLPGRPSDLRSRPSCSTLRVRADEDQRDIGLAGQRPPPGRCVSCSLPPPVRELAASRSSKLNSFAPLEHQLVEMPREARARRIFADDREAKRVLARRSNCLRAEASALSVAARRGIHVHRLALSGCRRR